ncbi:hypothetical protein GCM10027275_47780 [Rhabdobacter roseus]|uniref:YceK/YidQ family lipoprotein n=1 Tax=Rhabdobacter roseus TaxID=1655419 RepID=A0A840U3C3_9BACT|nr:hypothetical protein [Rhabdobacter roseus]MBB5286339.1 hypothetical protein [Rhabdobacter roseus]
MKKMAVYGLAVLMAASLSGCATIFGGPVTECQKTKPAPGEPQREVRVGALLADIIIFLPSLIVDFATGAIYKPCDKRTTELSAPTLVTKAGQVVNTAR